MTRDQLRQLRDVIGRLDGMAATIVLGMAIARFVQIFGVRVAQEEVGYLLETLSVPGPTERPC